MDVVLTGIAAQQLSCAVGNHLIGIHIVTSASPGLEWIDHELRIPLHVHDFLRGLGN